MHAITGDSLALWKRAPFGGRGVRASAAVALAAVAILAVRGAAALPSTGAGDAASSSAPAEPPPLQYMGSAAAAGETPAVPADSSAQRFTGRIGEDLTRSLQAAGVPEG